MSNLDLAQVEQLKLIGAQLHQTRQEQSRALEEIAAVTYIPLRILRAIEVGQVEILPEPVFVQGFIRRYADVLGLDGILLSRQFPINGYSSPQPASTKLLDTPPVTPQPAQPQKHLFRKQSAVYVVPTIIGVVVVSGLVIYGIRSWIGQVSPQGSTVNSANSSQTTSSPRNSPQASPSIPPAASSPPSVVVSPAVNQASPGPGSNPTRSDVAPVQVDLKLSGESWVQIKVDGQTKFSGTLQAGEQQRWSATQSLTIKAGNAGAVSLAVNGGIAQPMGQIAAVEEVTLTPTSIKPSASPATQP